MTANQINWAKLQEDKRHNLASEGETSRHNVAVEAEQTRSNQVNEALKEAANENDAYRNQISEQHYRVSDQESITHNRATEALQSAEVGVRAAELGIKQQEADIKRMSADTAQYKVETERKVAEEATIPESLTRRSLALQQITQSTALTPVQVRQAVTQSALNESKVKTEAVQRVTSVIHAGNETANTIMSGFGKIGAAFKTLQGVLGKGGKS